MGRRIEVRLPRYPECWETCGSCSAGEVEVLEVLVAPGERLARDDNVIVLETGKVALDIPTPHAGTVVEVCVAPGERVDENALILILEEE